jgi:hypothetical protein
METAALVVVCPPALLATAVSKWLPLESVVVLSEKLKGALVTAGPALVPSTLNRTLVVLADALVEMVTVPETVAPEAGEVMATVGGVVPPPPPPEPEPLQAGKDRLLVNGEAITQVFGCGGISGGGNLTVAGDSACCAAASKVLLVIVTGSQPPPFQKLLALPSDAIALAILFDICTGPQGGSEEFTFQT